MVFREITPETAQQTAESVIEQSAVTTAKTVAEKTADAVAKNVAVSVVDGFRDGASQLNKGAGKLSDGASQLAANSAKLVDGAQQLDEGAQKLSDGVAQLLSGSLELSDGMAKFDEEGIRKIADLYQKDLQPLMDSFAEMKGAAKEYTTFSGAAEGMDSSVRFIIKSEEVG